MKQNLKCKYLYEIHMNHIFIEGNHKNDARTLIILMNNTFNYSFLCQSKITNRSKMCGNFDKNFEN